MDNKPTQKMFNWFWILLGCASAACVGLFATWLARTYSPTGVDTGAYGVIQIICIVVLAMVIVIAAVRADTVIQLENYALTMLADALAERRKLYEEEERADDSQADG